MARFITAAMGTPVIGVAAVAASAVLSPSMWVLLAALVTIVILGVNITAWLVVPRVLESTFASLRPGHAGWGPADRGSERDAEWSSTTEWQSEAWSTSWDYADGDSADNAADTPDDDWLGDHTGPRGRRRSGQ